MQIFMDTNCIASISPSDTIGDIAAHTHYTAFELAEIVMDIVNGSEEEATNDED